MGADDVQMCEGSRVSMKTPLNALESLTGELLVHGSRMQRLVEKLAGQVGRPSKVAGVRA